MNWTQQHRFLLGADVSDVKGREELSWRLLELLPSRPLCGYGCQIHSARYTILCYGCGVGFAFPLTISFSTLERGSSRNLCNAPLESLNA